MAQETKNGSAPKTTTLAALQRSREIVALAPSGNYYKIRPLNLERHVLAGGLPKHLRKLALEGAEGVSKLFAAEDGEVSEEGEMAREYLDALVCQVIIEPKITENDIDLLLPIDYRWAVAIAMGEEDRDGEGSLLWGREPLSRFGPFPAEHGCAADCDACSRARAALPALSGG